MAEFTDRRDAGARLALHLQGYAERPDVQVMALDAGGIAVGYELALRLGLQLVLFDQETVANLVPESTIILAVDGVETAASIVPSLRALRAHSSVDLVAAIPVGCADACSALSEYLDDIVCLVSSPRRVDLAYRDFSPTTDAEALELLGYASRRWRELSHHGSHGW